MYYVYHVPKVKIGMTKDLGTRVFEEQGYDPAKVAEIIDLPEDHMIGMMLTIGKAVKPANTRGGQIPQSQVVFENNF